MRLIVRTVWPWFFPWSRATYTPSADSTIDGYAALRNYDREGFPKFEQGGTMRATFLGKDPNSVEGESPTLFATDRTDRVTYIAQGWRVTDPQVLADVGPVPDHETLIEIPEDVLKMYARRYAEEGN
jgi:hypothetical protein